MKLHLISLLFLFAFGLTAQTYIDIPWREGVVTKDGQEQPGMIRLGGDLGAPWLNHSKVYFVTNEVYAAEKKHPGKKVTMEYAPDDLEGYTTYTEDKAGNRVDMTFVRGEIMMVKGLSKKPTNVFLHQIEKGPVTILSYIPMPEHEVLPSDEQRSQDDQQALNETIIYLKKGNDAFVVASEVEVADLLSECPEVVSKIKSQAYGFADLSVRPKKKGLSKMVVDSYGNNELENKICTAVKEYNSCVK